MLITGCLIVCVVAMGLRDYFIPADMSPSKNPEQTYFELFAIVIGLPPSLNLLILTTFDVGMFRNHKVEAFWFPVVLGAIHDRYALARFKLPS
jgi:hypothetical protein